MTERWNRWHLNKLLMRNATIREPDLFFERIAQLLHEGYPLNESLALVLPHHVKESDVYSEKIEQQFQEGAPLIAIFETLPFRNVQLLPLYTAEKTGNVEQACLEVSRHTKQMVRFQTELRKLLTYPFALLLFFLGILFLFKWIILPRMDAVYAMQSAGERMSFVTTIVQKGPDLLLSALVTCVIFLLYMKRRVWDQAIDPSSRLFQWTPVARFVRIAVTRSFALELGHLLQASVTVREALAHLAEQSTNLYIQRVSKRAYEQLKEGVSLQDSLKMEPYVDRKLASFVEQGALKGLLDRELLLYAHVLERATTDRIERSIQWVQPILFGLIGIGVVIAYLSVLLPMYDTLHLIE